jgi:hypothetical protein
MGTKIHSYIRRSPSALVKEKTPISTLADSMDAIEFEVYHVRFISSNRSLFPYNPTGDMGYSRFSRIPPTRATLRPFVYRGRLVH